MQCGLASRLLCHHTTALLLLALGHCPAARIYQLTALCQGVKGSSLYVHRLAVCASLLNPAAYAPSCAALYLRSGARGVPHAFVIDANGKITYSGRWRFKSPLCVLHPQSLL